MKAVFKLVLVKSWTGEVEDYNEEEMERLSENMEDLLVDNGYYGTILPMSREEQRAIRFK